MAAGTQRHTDLLRVDWEQRGDRSLAPSQIPMSHARRGSHGVGLA